ncbi:MAG TPA: zinc finger domain-containing protein, partial [Flavobacterium sp.]|nr:zinc finger domain-containing protein [Flavobacterium sp.]
TVAHLQAGLAKRNSAIKTVLLDQSLVAGLGNIYVDESLHRAGISPLRKASKLAVEEVKRLYESAREVLKEAVRAGGSSSKDYLRSSGKKGSFQNSHAVYRRTGQPCFNCGEPIERVVINGRSTHYCLRCQR